MLEDLRQDCPYDVFDYLLLMSHLKEYKAPHRKITTLLSSGKIIRIKKGLYTFNEAYQHYPIHRGLIANLLFGPSYVSQEYALSHYGFIPERVETVTSMTTKRNKSFITPFGTYTYHYLNLHRYNIGVHWEKIKSSGHYFIASPEKALVDTIASYRDIQDEKEMILHLIENLRIDPDALKQLNLNQLKSISKAYQSPVINLLIQTLHRKKF